MSKQPPAEAVALIESPSSNTKECSKNSMLVFAPTLRSVAILKVAPALLSVKSILIVTILLLVLDIITLLNIKDDWAGAVNKVVCDVLTKDVPVDLKKLLI